MPVDSQIDACLNGAELEAVLVGELSAADMSRLMRHVTGCAQCRARLRGAGFSDSQLRAQVVPDTLTCGTLLDQAADTGAHVGVTPGPQPQPARGGESWRHLLAPPQDPAELGRLGGYRVLRVLGSGGMGIVFEAEDPSLSRRVAIKVLRPGDIDEWQRKRFVQEAQLAASLSSERIVTVHQVGEDRGCMFIVMELLNGEALEARLKRERSLPPVEALRIAREVAEGLAAAHSKHLVHRDIKPANVWLEAKRPDESACRVKLLDFGVARPITVEEHLTIGGQIVGTPSYMSPEQACGLPVDERSDLFSLGCLIYVMLSGRSPFERSNYVEVLKAVVDEPARLLAELLPGLPPQVDRLVQKLLNKESAARPNTARQVVQEIRHLEQNLTSAGLMMPAPNTATLASAERRVRQNLGWGVWAGAVAILLAALLGAWGGYHQLRERAGDPQLAKVAMVGAPVATPKTIASEPGTAARPAANNSTSTSTAGSSDSGAASPPINTNPPATADSTGPTGGTAQSAAVKPGELPADDTQPAAANPDLPTIKVGIIHSLTGPMATSERSIVDAFVMAAEEINEAGGLLGGRMIETVVRDGKSNERVFAEQAEDLITGENVVTLFGCWRSPCRKLVEAVCRRHDHLLVYPTTYEGLEDSPYVVYMGGAPNQQIVPAVKWAFAFLGKRKFYLVGVDGIYSRTAHEIIRDELKSLGGEVVGEGFRPLGDTAFTAIAQEVVDSEADMVINTVSGNGNISLFHCLREVGVMPDEVPTMSFKVSEEELQNISGVDQDLAGDYAGWSYFESLRTDDNDDFVKWLQDRYGPTRVASDPMAAAYAGMYLWARAVYECQSDKVVDIRRAIVAEHFDAPEGEVTIDRDNHHAFRSALIGRVNEDLQFDIVWTSPGPIPPDPWPATRTRDEWRSFQRELYKKWGGNWRPTAPSK